MTYKIKKKKKERNVYLYKIKVKWKHASFLFNHIQHNILKGPGGRLNKKDGLTRYGDSHVKDKTS